MARVGAARIFFDVVGTFQASRLIKDSRSQAAVMSAIWLDTLGGMAEGIEQIFQQVQETVDESMESFFAYENQLARVRKFYQGSPEEIDRFSAAALELGHAFAFTGEEALKASARTAQLKQILGSQEAVIAGTEAGLMMAAVGEMETELGMNRLINLAQQTQMFMGGLEKATYDKMTAEQQAIIVTKATTHALDQLNTVENSSVATMEDITFVLNQFASQAHIAGENIAEMSAKAALLLETGEEVSRAGTGLRMIYQRLGVATGDAAQAVAEAVPEWDAATVTTKSLTEVLEAIQPAYANMNSEQKRQFAIQIAGARHYIKFLKLMENHDRLSELTTAAIEKQYTAQGDFNEIAKTAAFRMKQLEANMFNLQTQIGEELAESYLIAAKAQERFLTGLLSIVQTGFGKDMASGILVMSQAYTHLIQPVSDMYLKIFNLIIAVRTYNAVMRAHQTQAEMQTGAYMRNIAAHKLLALEKTRLVQIQGSEISQNVAYWKIQVGRARNAMEIQSRERAGIVANQQALQRAREEVRLNIIERKNLGLEVERSIRYEAYYTQQIKAGSTQQMMATKALQANVKSYQAAQVAQAQRQISLQTSNMLSKMELKDRIAITSATEAHYQAVMSEVSAMRSEHMVLVPLGALHKQRIQDRIMDIRTTIQKLEVQMSDINLQILELELQGKSTAALQQKRTAIMGEIQANTASIASMESKIVASDMLTKQIERERIANLTGKDAIIAKMFATQNLTMAVKMMSGAFLGALMILPMFVDEGKQTKVMMFAMAGMILYTAVPAIYSMMVAAYKAAGAVGLMTGGVSLALGVIAAWGAIEMMPDAEEQISDVASMNEELLSMADTLAEIKGLGDDPVAVGWLADELGLSGINWEDVRTDADTAAEVFDRLSQKKESLEAGKKAALDAGQTTMAETFATQLTDLEDIYTKAEAANKLHQDRMLMQSMKGWTDQEKLQYHYGDEMVARWRAGATYGRDSDWGGKSVHYGDEVGHYGHEGVSDEGNWWTRTHYALGGWIADEAGWAEYEMSWDAVHDKIADENSKLTDAQYDENPKILAAYNELSNGFELYFEDMTTIVEEGSEEILDALVQGNTSILAEEEAFNSNREELFWGSRSNVTGQLYKKVMEGGVENLLMKTELLQTNNFYGLTMDEAVVKVTDGVMNRLSLAGVV
tara:strand:- start:8476 stop:11997 length:3522 start_codon:yes stop_codon:yes gene_type:complete